MKIFFNGTRSTHTPSDVLGTPGLEVGQLVCFSQQLGQFSSSSNTQQEEEEEDYED